MNKATRFIIILLIGLSAAACLSSSEEGTQGPSGSSSTSTSDAAILPKSSDESAWATAAYTGPPPEEPPSAVASWLTDPRTPDNAEDAYAVDGDDFGNNRYERPIDADLAYRHDLDILSASLTLDPEWFYILLLVEDVQPGEETPDACFGIELDVNLDGRGEFVIWARPPFATRWARENMIIYGTSTGMVGGPHPLLSDAPWEGETYDTILFDPMELSQENWTWVRVSPTDPKELQIAFSPEILEQPIRFLWNVWADDGIKEPSRFDYNDVFTKKDAGSPYKWDPEYPPKSIWAVDNTCRAPYGFKPVGNIPGLCGMETIPPPTVEGPTPTFTLIPPPK